MQLMCACETSIVHAECWVSYFTVSQRLADCETRNMIRIALPCIVPRQSVTNVNAFQRQLSYLRRVRVDRSGNQPGSGATVYYHRALQHVTVA